MAKQTKKQPAKKPTKKATNSKGKMKLFACLFVIVAISVVTYLSGQKTQKISELFEVLQKPSEVSGITLQMENETNLLSFQLEEEVVVECINLLKDIPVAWNGTWKTSIPYENKDVTSVITGYIFYEGTRYNHKFYVTRSGNLYYDDKVYIAQSDGLQTFFTTMEQKMKNAEAKDAAEKAKDATETSE